MALTVRHRQLLRLIHADRALSRWELHQRTGINANSVGADVSAMLRMGVIREGSPAVTGPGRPRVPLVVDPSTRHILGLAIGPDQVQIASLNLLGQLHGRMTSKPIKEPDQIVPAARALLNQARNTRTIGLGVSSPGFIDPSRRAVLFGLLLPGRPPLSLQGLYDAAGGLSVVFENDMHALAARWLLTHQAEEHQDVLLVYFADGRMGAAMLIDGRPNRGCMIAANELGHMRLPVPTPRCYCGHTGCLERICSSEFLAASNGRHAGPVADGLLLHRAAEFDAADEPMARLLEYLGSGLANIVNFVRPARLVLVSEMTRYDGFRDALLRQTRVGVLRELVQRVRIDVWDQPDPVSAETAGWLALAGIYREGWAQQ